MIDRKEFATELQLRDQIRQVIQIVENRRVRRDLLAEGAEKELKNLIRSLIREGTGVADTAKHNNTGINALEDLLKNTNVLSVLENGYKSLTTDKEQRDSYRNHILNAVKASLAPEESRKEGGGDLSEDVSIEIGDPTDDPDFIDVEEEEVSDEETEKNSFAIAGHDKTGRNRAFTDWSDIQKVILTSFDDLDNPEDIELFEEYLIKNLALYFDKFEVELVPSPDEPPEAADAEPDAGVEAAADEEEAGEEVAPAEEEEEVEDIEDVAAIELQEIIKHLNIDDIIKNLL